MKSSFEAQSARQNTNDGAGGARLSMELVDRLESERAFHNALFSENHRVATDRFYSITRNSAALYVRSIEELGANKRVLELGCGDGNSASAFELAKLNANVVGIDISEVAVEKANQRAAALHCEAQARFQTMNAEMLAFEPDTFDLICGTGILHHLDLSKVLPEMSRTMKPTGSAVFLEPLGHNPLIGLYRWATPKLRTPDEHPLRMTDLKTASQYFESVEPHFFHLNTLGAVPFRRFSAFPRLVEVLDSIDQRLFRLMPAMKRFAWLVVLVFSRPRKQSAPFLVSS